MRTHDQRRIPPPALLLNGDQDGFIFHNVKPAMLGGKPFPGRDPDVSSIRGELAENPGTTGQIVGRFWDQVKSHPFFRLYNHE
jgi:hypothetical protein